MASDLVDFTTHLVSNEEPTTDVSVYENITAPDSSLLKNFQYVNISVRLVMGFLAIGGNLLTVVAIAHYEYLRSCTNYLIASLATADLVSGFSCLILLINYVIPMTDEIWLKMCAMEFTIISVPIGFNISYILLISLDRFIFITFPLRYHSLVTSRLTIGAILMPTVLAIIHIMAVHLMIDEYQLPPGRICRGVFPKSVGSSLNLWFYVITPFTVVLYTRIAWIAYRQTRAIEQIQNVATKKEHKITKMLSLVLGVYLACYVPQLFVLTLRPYMNMAPETFIIVERISSWAWWINSWSNPFIYAWKNKEFNRAFRSLLGLKNPTIDPMQGNALA